MFKKKANTVFNNGANNCLIISDMHPQMKRLYEAALELKQTEGQTEVAKLMNSSPQALNNWETRGISKEGLIDAQQFIGCDLIWLRDGTGSMVRSAAPNYELAARLLLLFGAATDQGQQQIIRMAESVQKRTTR